MGATGWVILFCCVSVVCSSTVAEEPFSLKKWNKLLSFLSDSTQDDEILHGSKNGYQEKAQQLKEYKCDFETKQICDFLFNDKSNKEHWKIGRGKLNSFDTGPSVDHTLGTANGSYLYVNVSAAENNDVKIQTVALTGDYCVRFFYHMYGPDIDLIVEAKSEARSSDKKQYFGRSKTQGDRWKEAIFTVTPSANMILRGYRVVFTAKNQRNSIVKGDIALDDLELTPGKCPDTKKDASLLCTFDDYNCGYYTSSRTSKMSWEWKAQGQNLSYFKMMPQKDHTLGTDAGGYWFSGFKNRGILMDNKSTVLNSPLNDKPKTAQNCLHFYFYVDGDGSSLFKGRVKEAFVQVHLHFPDSKDGQVWITTKAKNTTNHRQWTYVEARAEITQKYQVQFTAFVNSAVDALLAIDDIKMVSGSCPEAGSCDFEDDKCTWLDGDGNYSWVRKSGSSYSEIGPKNDHTKNSADGNYLVFSTKNKPAGSVANLESEVFAAEEPEKCLSFYFYMSGDDLGTLKVLRNEGNPTQATLWVLRGDQGDMWKKGSAVIRKSMSPNQIIVQGITGAGKNGSMAFDDIRVRKGEKCQLEPAEAEPPFEDDYDNFTKTTEDYFDFNNNTEGYSSFPTIFNVSEEIDYMSSTNYPEKLWNKTRPDTTCGSKLCVHGLCERFENNWNCRCNNGYTGIECDTYSTERKMVWVIIILLVAVVTLQLFTTCYYMAKRRRTPISL